MATRRVMLTRPERHYPQGQEMKGGGDPLYRGVSHTPFNSLSTGPATRSKDVTQPTLQGLLSLAGQLAPDEQKQLLDQLAWKATQVDPASHRDIEMWATSIYEALQKALGASAGAMGGPILVKRAVAATSSWKPVADFMQASKLSELQVRERLSVYQLLADLLVNHAKYVAQKSGAPLSPKLISNCTGSISGVFDKAFPGYLHAGLAPVVARRLAAGLSN